MRVPFAEKEEQRNEYALTFEKSRSKRYTACSDVVEVTGLEPELYRFFGSCTVLHSPKYSVFKPFSFYLVLLVSVYFYSVRGTIRGTKGYGAASVFYFQMVNICLHSVCAALLHFIGDMSVNIKCKGHRSMSEILRYCLYIIASTNGGDGITMAQIVKTDRGEANACHNVLKMLIYGLSLHMLADFIGEYEIR